MRDSDWHIKGVIHVDAGWHLRKLSEADIHRNLPDKIGINRWQDRVQLQELQEPVEDEAGRICVEVGHGNVGRKAVSMTSQDLIHSGLLLGCRGRHLHSDINVKGASLQAEVRDSAVANVDSF